MEQLDLSDFFQTKAQARDFSNRLSSIEEKIYQTNFNLDNALLEQFGIQKKDKFISFLRDNKVNVGSGAALREMLGKVQQEIAALPVITLTIALEPTEKMIKELSDWVILNIKKQILFDIHVDKTLIGGSTINYGGKYLDCSIKPLFEAVIQAELEKKVDYAKYHATELKNVQPATAAPIIN
jgi:F0F1-type ATP synthase delta subunit